MLVGDGARPIDRRRRGRVQRYNDGGGRRSVPCQRVLVSSDQIVAAIGRPVASLTHTIHHPGVAVVAVDCCLINSSLDSRL